MARLSLAPLLPPPPAAPAALPPTAVPEARPRQVQLWWDDATAATPWLQALAAEGPALRGAPLDAARTAGAALPDAAVLHLSHGLPQQLSRLRELRSCWPRLPLVVVCRQLRELDHVLALEMGADDVLDAHVAAPVVAARLRALWRRCEAGAAAGDTPAPAELRFGALEISLPARRAALGGRSVGLTEGEFELLWLLASHAGRTLARRDLLAQVRGLTDHPTDRSIDSRVYRLRAKLGDSAPQRIRTVRHFGYLFSTLPW